MCFIFFQPVPVILAMLQFVVISPPGFPLKFKIYRRVSTPGFCIAVESKNET